MNEHLQPVLVEYPVPSTAPPALRQRPLLTSKFIVAIDFGTTFTGVAWGHFDGSTSVDGHSSNTKWLAERVFIYKKWPGSSNAYAEKTPTVISYASKQPTWGGKVRSHHKLQVSWFKLGLDPENVRDVFGLEDGVVGLVPELHRSALDVTADFLTQVNQHIKVKALADAFGEGFPATQGKMYMLTVPDIWSDRAKDLTHQAAMKAGIPVGRMVLVTEPEAAALFASMAGDQVDLEKHDAFVICDAGGRTVV